MMKTIFAILARWFNLTIKTGSMRVSNNHANINMSKKNNITVNGNTFTGRNLTISNGKVIIDGVEQKCTNFGTVINVTINAPVDNIDMAGDLTVNGDVRTVNVSCGDATISGNVSGNVDVDVGDVKCGHVGGSVKVDVGDITHK